MTRDEDLVAAVRDDWRSARVNDRERAILAYTDKLATAQTELSSADVDELRLFGLRDDEVLAVVMLAGFFRLATLIADALGVELDKELTR